jgi:predicted regulator of Ras-like GTPase activity (Roadblock/LC7/MglB family)
LNPKTSANKVEATFVHPAALISVGQENFSFASLSASLVEIRKLKGVIGYILRSNSSAIIDLEEPENIIKYALLSSQIYDTCQEIAQQFNLGETESMLVEGENVKVLCIGIGENKVNVFMERAAAHAEIIKNICFN